MAVLGKRLFCSQVPKKWAVKQVTKSSFSESLEEIKSHISSSDFLAVSLQKTGSFSAPWHRLLPFDTADIAYSKAKFSAERFQLFQFALCPFSLQNSKLIAHPYNYLLYPRDELKLGMPSYSFSCQSSHLTSMAREGFDFNSCIYDGISYLSREQETAAKLRIGNPRPNTLVFDSDFSPSVADSVFMERIKSRLINWKYACKNPKDSKNEVLMNSLRKLILGSEYFGSRPSMNLDVCSERQVQLVLEVLRKFSGEIVPLLVPAKSGGTQAVRVVLASSKEDRELFEEELRHGEEEENKKFQGFREVIDLISASQKPVVSYNSLTDFTFIHSKFLAPLPSTIDEFVSSLRLVFPHVLDVSHLMKVNGPLRKVTNIPAAISYLNNHFFAPVDVEVSHQATENESRNHGLNVLRLCHLFAKLCSIHKIGSSSTKSENNLLLAPPLEECTNVFNAFSTSSGELIDEDISVWTKSMRKVSCKQLVFLWGFGSGTTAGKLKSLLDKSHHIFSENFDVRLVDKSCAIVVFWQAGLAEAFLDVMNNSKELSGSLREMVSEGLKAASYETYKRVCNLPTWEADLGEALDKALEDPDHLEEAHSKATSTEICWSNEDVINLDDL